MNRGKPVVGETYHIYNRGVDKRDIFSDSYDVQRFLLSLELFNTVDSAGGLYSLAKLGSSTSQLRSDSLFSIRSIGTHGRVGNFSDPLVEIVAYHLLPNHYHLLLTQVAENGISEYVRRLGGYTKYFNEKYERSGTLFQGRYKFIHVTHEAYLTYLMAYISCNDLVHGSRFSFSIPEILQEKLSSRYQYQHGGSGLCSTSLTQDFVGNDKYWSEAENVALKVRKNRALANFLLENE